MDTIWNYTERAATYDLRAPYSEIALDRLLRATGCVPGTKVADVGAGTGKLTVPLLNRGMVVNAVEPNDAMRAFGIENSKGRSVTWSEASGEATGLSARSVHAAFFGSSFNVVNQAAALHEVARILAPRGYFGCMWNHRDLDDPLQREVEAIFKREVPNYDYGDRRKDPTEHIVASGLFDPAGFIEERFPVSVDAGDWILAWRSHATLARQVGEGRMDAICAEIAERIHGEGTIHVPYHTRIWFARLS